MAQPPHNPPVAVALHYDGKNAPQVVATGRGATAERILAVARDYNIPLHADPELSAALAQLRLGAEIPEALYRAVAEVLSFALFVSGRYQTLLAEREAELRQQVRKADTRLPDGR